MSALAEPAWAGRLVPVPTGVGSCRTCHGPCPEGMGQCHGCDRLDERYRALAPDVVIPVAIAVTGGALAGALWRYKAGPPALRNPTRQCLSDLLGHWLAGHRRCVSGDDALVGSVPGRAPGDQLSRLAAAAGLPVHPLLGWQHGGLAVPAPGLVQGAPVLLLDDTWTSGATAASGAAALKRAGATSVAVLVIGRHVGLGDPGAPRYLRELRGQTYQWDRCCRCAGPAEPGGGW